jgi:hypothetical protein
MKTLAPVLLLLWGAAWSAPGAAQEQAVQPPPLPWFEDPAATEPAPEQPTTPVTVDEWPPDSEPPASKSPVRDSPRLPRVLTVAGVFAFLAATAGAGWLVARRALARRQGDDGLDWLSDLASIESASAQRKPASAARRRQRADVAPPPGPEPSMFAPAPPSVPKDPTARGDAAPSRPPAATSAASGATAMSRELAALREQVEAAAKRMRAVEMQVQDLAHWRDQAPDLVKAREIAAEAQRATRYVETTVRDWDARLRDLAFDLAKALAQAPDGPAGWTATAGTPSAPDDARPVARAEAPPEPDVASLLDALENGGVVTGDQRAELEARRCGDARDLLHALIVDHLPLGRPIPDYRRMDEVLRAATEDRCRLVLAEPNERVDDARHRVAMGRAVDRGAIGRVLEMMRPGFSVDGALCRKAEVVESR